MRRAALTLIIATLWHAHAVAEQQNHAAAGPIERLTPDMRDAALQCGRSGAECAVRRYQLCGRENARYAIRLITPFSRVAEAALDDKEGRKPLGRIGPATVNRWGIALSVFPEYGVDTAAAIEHVEIQKDGQRLPPSIATVGPITIPAADGSAKQSTRGFFVFPASAFEPSSDTVIVLVGSSGTEACRIDRKRLQTLQ